MKKRFRLPKTICFFFLIAFSLWAAPQKKLLNGAAASVGKDLITIQEAYIYRAIQRLKNGEYPAVQIETGEALKRTIQKAAFEHMVYLELKSFEFESAARSEAENNVKELKTKIKAQEWGSVLSKFELSDKELSEKMYRTIQVEKFMQKKVEILTPTVTEEEIEKYFREDPSRFKGSSYEQMKPNIEVLLRKKEIQKGLEEWIQFLKKKYGFAIHLPG